VRSCTLKGALREAMLRGAGVQGGVEQRQSDDGVEGRDTPHLRGKTRRGFICVMGNS
jgi:hypothetical protein